MIPRDNEALMRVSEAAKALGVKVNRIYVLIDLGALDHEIWNRHVYVTRESVETRQRLLELPDHMLSLTETAEFLGVSRHSVSRYIHKGLLSPVSTSTKRTLFDPVDVARLAARHGREGKPRAGRPPGVTK